jgi:hypothetical protein
LIRAVCRCDDLNGFFVTPPLHDAAVLQVFRRTAPASR